MNHLFLFSFTGVFLKAFQQLNVTSKKYWAVPVFSIGMAASEVFIVWGVVDYGITTATVLNMGIGGTLGCWAAMVSHGKLFKERV